MPSGNPIMVARGVARRFGYRPILSEVSFELHAGQVLLLVGPNGAGKTTLLRMLAGLLKPNSGSIELHAPVGVVAHDSMLYGALTARENLRFFARLHGLSGQARVDELLEHIGLSDRADDRLGTYSRGMVQRVAIARALLHEPGLLLFDEPLSGLDDKTSHVLLDLLVSLRDRGTAMIIVSHQLAGLGRIATHLARLARGRLGPIATTGGRDPAAVLADMESTH
jgi:ABC-type multidrug transport system ATPase subunit